MPEFSVIILCHQDEQALHHLLEQLNQIPGGAKEVIVVDGGNSSICRDICQAYQVRWLPSQPCRGLQLLGGASLAQGRILWFLHADARISHRAFAAMSKAINNGAIGGFFRFRFDKPRKWPATFLEAAIALRCRVGIPYGDQGLFLLRKHYGTANGHAPWPLFEEVPLVKNARQIGKFIALREPILINPRRWNQEGWWRRTWNNRKLALKFVCGATPQTLATRYQTEKTMAKQ